MDLPILDDCLLRLLVVRDSSESESRGGNGWRCLPPSQQTQFRFHRHFIPHHRVHNHFPYKAATKPAFRPMDSQQFSAPLPQQGFYPNPNIAPAANPPKMNTQPMPQQMMAPATFGDTPQQVPNLLQLFLLIMQCFFFPSCTGVLSAMQLPGSHPRREAERDADLVACRCSCLVWVRLILCMRCQH